MKKSREGRIQELVTNYKHWNKLDNPLDNYWTAALARDNKRKIRKIFLKEIHEPIENFL